MAKLEYSRGALDTLTLFHKRRWIVFVEGQDDVSFWREVFRIASEADAFFKVAGGKDAIERLQVAAVDGADIVVARDADWLHATGSALTHERVLHTVGYSIENTLCSTRAISEALELYGAANDDLSPQVESWMTQFETGIRELVVLDLAIHIADAGVSVPLANALRLLDARRRDHVSSAAVEREAKKLRSSVDHSVRAAAETKLLESRHRLWYHIRGHCVASAVLHFLSVRASRMRKRKVALSSDALFGILTLRLPAWLPNSDEWAAYERQIRRLQAAA